MTSLIDDETATRYYNEIDTAPEEERQQMADALLAWGEEKQSREREETDTHFSKLFTDDSYYQQVNDNDPSLSEALDPEATAKRASIHAYLEHQLARPIDAANYEPERDAFAMANYGKKNLDDGQLFEAIRGTYDFQRQRTEAINDLHVQSVGKALADTNLGMNRPFVEGMTGVFNEWQQKYPELVDGKEDAAYLAQAYKLYYDTINDLDAVRPIAGKTLSTLDAFTKGNASGEDLQSLAQTLAQATPEDRDKVYKYVTLGAQAGQIDRAGIEQFAINLGQSFSRGFDFIPQGSLQQMESGVESFLNGIRNGSQVWVPSSGDLTKAVVGNASPDAAAQAAQEGAWRQASVGETETLIASANDAMQTFQVVRELRNVAKTGVDPIRPVMEKGSVMGAVEGGAYGVAGSIGFLGATAINPFLGVAAYQANEYDRIRLENPDMDIRAAQGLALVEGTWQAALDRVQLATLSGKLPVLGRFLGSIENNGIRRTLKVGASVAEQFGQELAQDTGTIVIDNIAAALREDMPDKDFAAEMAKYGEQIPETLAASVMFGLVGGGFATAADLGVTEQQMKIVGINDKKIARIKQATSPEEADALIQSALESRTSEDIEAGKTYARQVFNEAQNPPPESPKISLVAGQDGTDEYLVTAPDGSEMLRTKSQQAAMEAVRQDAESKLLTERNTVRDMVDYFRAQDPTNEATIEAPRTVQAELDRLTEAGDAKGIANLNERIRFAGIPEGADLTAYNILGEANVETTAEGVFKGVIRLRENSRPEDAFEEINHVFVRKALAEGRTNLDSLRGWLQQTSEATGETYATETETDIIENIAKVGMDYAAGRIEETSLPASFVDYIKRMLQVLKETMARAIKLKDAFATGKIDSNFESFLAESVGLNQQTMVDTTRERASGDIITDGGQMLMDFSIGSRTSAVSTDTPAIRASNATITGPANYSIGAFHGTPHKVDKFSLDKIGTGEGAQAYGWGLYFAQAKAVGEGYRDQLGGIRLMTADGQMADNIVSTPGAKKILKEARVFWKQTKSLDGFVKQLEASKSQSKVWAAQGDNVESNSQYVKDVDEVLSVIKDATPTQTGNLYSVELDVDDADLLDWDKPLSGQSEKVQAALAEMNPDYRPDSDEYDANEQGQITYTRITSDQARFGGINPEMMASVTLRDYGIKGIRYLDGSSRSEGIGTYNYVVFDENLIKITEENGNRIPASQALAAPATGATNYSIASQSEIDRVNAALGGMNRGPDERLKVYERAKQKFSKLMAWNSDELGAMADTGSDETQIRRTQILQGLGELDGILSVLPPEVRGKIGGYTKLAGIAPHDLFKDGVKVSEVSGMNGAIISAWMREGQNIGQAGKQVSLPPGYTATENLSTKRADKAIADFFRDRIKKIDTELEKVLVREYTEAITKVVKQSRPKAGDNGVRKSTLGAETQKFADMVQRATLLDDEATPKRMAEIEAALANPDATAEDISALSEEWSILNTFGDLDNRSSETLAQGLDWLKGQLQMGREAWRIKEEARIAENRERAKKTVEWVGGATAQDRFRDKTLIERMGDWANNLLLDHASFEQFVNALLPPEIAADFSTRLRKADVAAQKTEIDQREGILNALRAGAKAAGTTTGKALESLKTEVPNSVRYLDGRKVKNTKLTIEQSEKIVRGEIDRGDLTDTDVRNLADELAALPADTRKENITLKQVVYPGKEVRLPMTRGKAIQLLLSWNQPDVQDKMRREGWTDDSIVDLRELTSDPVSQAMLAHAQELYGKGYAVTNPVYARMFGMNMPQAKNYAPTRFNHSKDVKDVGLDGSPVATGTTPGFAKSRVSHSAKIAPEDALGVMQQHILAQSHWVNFAELAREFRSLITNPEVRESIKQKHGQAVLKTAELWADQMEQRGGNQAREAAWVNNILGAVIGGQSVASLGFNLKTLAMQLDNAVRFALALDTKQIVSAMQSPDQLIQDIKTVFESDALQTRLRGGATAEARFLFEKYGGRPGRAAKVSEVAMSAINWMDSATTSFSAAIVYRANLNQALESGMPENLARETALDAAAAAIYRFAQPVSFGQKSNMENSGNIYQKAFFLFMSDPRLKASIMADSIRGLATGRGDKWTHIRRLVSIELMAVLSHVVASAYRDAFTDDDDEEIWSPGGWARAILLAPVQGYLFLGTMLDSVFSQLTGAGFFTPTQNPLLSVAQTGIRALRNADDILAFDDPDALLKEWVSIARMLAVTPTMAAPAVLLNMVKPVVGAYQNATTEE